jgi:hypothetical protein
MPKVTVAGVSDRAVPEVQEPEEPEEPEAAAYPPLVRLSGRLTADPGA